MDDEDIVTVEKFALLGAYLLHTGTEQSSHTGTRRFRHFLVHHLKFVA